MFFVDLYQLHRAEHRLTDMEKPRSDDVLWNLPDYLFSLIEDDHSQSASYSQVRYDTIRDAVLTCAQKVT